MSIFATIDKDLHTFGAWAEKELGKLSAEAPKLAAVADAILKYAGPALQTVVTMEAGAPAGAVVGNVIADAQSSIVAANGLLTDIGPSPSVASVIGSVQTNLSALLTAGHVTNAKSVATVTKVAAEMGSLAAAVTAAVPPAKA